MKLHEFTYVDTERLNTADLTSRLKEIVRSEGYLARSSLLSEYVLVLTKTTVEGNDIVHMTFEIHDTFFTIKFE